MSNSPVHNLKSNAFIQKNASKFQKVNDHTEVLLSAILFTTNHFAFVKKATSGNLFLYLPAWVTFKLPGCGYKTFNHF